MKSRITWFVAAAVVVAPLAVAAAASGWGPEPSDRTFETASSGEQIGLRTGDGSSSASLVAECSEAPFLGCVIGHREDKTVRFILPPGYKRVDFSTEEKNKRGHSGGNAKWATDDPHDATVAIHAWADAFSKIEIVVSNVIGEKE